MRKKKWYMFVLIGALAGLIAGVCARPAYLLYRDISFGWTEHTQTELRVKEYAAERGIFYGEYPQSLIELLERNPETEEFVLNYPFREKVDFQPQSYDPGEIPLFLQWDPCWGYTRYGSDFLGITGCGPTCLAMVGYYLTGDTSMTPDAVARFAEKNGYYASGYGSSWKLISAGAQKLGLMAQELPLVKSKLVKALESGQPIILALGSGDFTSTGHYIVLTAVEDGAFRIHDPNSRLRSEKQWSYEELEGQIRNIWAISAATEQP